MKLCTLDFEFCDTTEPKLNLVSCALDKYENGVLIESKDFWLHNESYQELKDYLLAHKEYVMVAFGAEAEARSMLAADIDILQFKWVCLHLEYRCLQNHSYELLHGEQLIDGKIKRTYPYGEKGKQSYAAVAYKLLGAVIDTKEKEEVRQLIISSPSNFTPDQKQRILAYGRSDIKYLYRILKSIIGIYRNRVPRNLVDLTKQMFLRGEYAARTAKMVALGYPINTQWLSNFADNAPMVIQECQRDIIRQFPANPPFRWNKKEQRFSMNQSALKCWIHQNHKEGWMLTDTGQYSLSLEAWETKYHFRHDYPEGNLGAQMLKYLKLSQSMKGYNPHADKSIFNDLGSDNRVRCYLNPYGAQSSRTQPASTGFVFLKPASQRSLVQARKGRAIGDLDYSSEEFLLAALMSKDRKMLEAYKSGDVYLAFGKDIGYIPKDGSKKTHKYERDIMKACLAKGSLVRVKDKGFVPIEKVTNKDLVWDGETWKSCEGAVLIREAYVSPSSSSVNVTDDHLIMGEDYEWRTNQIYKESQVHKRKVLKENSRGLYLPDYSWSDLWCMASCLFRSLINKARP